MKSPGNVRERRLAKGSIAIATGDGDLEVVFGYRGVPTRRGCSPKGFWRGVEMPGRRWILVSGMVLGVMPSILLADIHTIYGPTEAGRSTKFHRVSNNDHQHIHIIRRPRAGIVDRKLAEQPVHQHLFEMVVVHTRVVFDPDANYHRQGEGVIDENHHLLTDQRLDRDLSARGVYIIRAKSTRPERRDSGRVIVPHMIIRKPNPKSLRKFIQSPPPTATSPQHLVAASGRRTSMTR